jgi:hypothetical protein
MKGLNSETNKYDDILEEYISNSEMNMEVASKCLLMKNDVYYYGTAASEDKDKVVEEFINNLK